MKKVSSAKAGRKPISLNAAHIAANAVQVASARGASDQSILAWVFREEITSRSDKALIAIPYQSGKKPGPGPSCPRYSQREAVTMMYAPSPPSARPDQKSALSGFIASILLFCFSVSGNALSAPAHTRFRPGRET